MSRTAIDLALAVPDTRLPLDAPAPWYVLIEAETAAAAFSLEPALFALLEPALESGLISDATVAQSETQRLAFWTLREAIAVAFVGDPSGIKSDTAVPVSRIPECVESATKPLVDYLPDIRCAPFGHVGDGNIHFNVLRPENMPQSDFSAHASTIRKMLNEEALKFGGTISAEHGIGTLKPKALTACLSSVEREIMQKMRAAISVKSLLNGAVTGLLSAALPIDLRDVWQQQMYRPSEGLLKL